jgi:hypothetical protein
MKNLRLALPLLLAVSVRPLKADSVPTYQITKAIFSMGPNTEGANASFVFTGPGTTITGFGGFACQEWCSGPFTDASVMVGEFFLSSFSSVVIGGVNYGSDLSLCCSFMPDGQLIPSVTGFVGVADTFHEIRLLLPQGAWTLHFVDVPPEGDFPGGQQFVHGEFLATAPLITPEPGTIGLMLTGLAGIAGILQKRGSIRRAA